MAEEIEGAAAETCRHPEESVFLGEEGEDTLFRDKPAYIICERCRKKISTNYLQDHKDEEEELLFGGASAA